MHRFSTARLLSAGAAIALISTPALAQDGSNYSGFYIAGSVGAAVQNNDKNDVVVFDTDRDGDFDDATVLTSGGADAFAPGFCNGAALSAVGGCDNDDDELEYAIKIGYDQQLGSNFVVGALIEGSKTDVRDSTSAFSITPASYTFTREMDWALSGRLRAGFTPNGKGLFYVTGGASYADVDQSFSTTNTANSFTLVDADDKLWGWQAGGGAEVNLGGGLGVGLEYLYSRYDAGDAYVDVGPGTAGPTNPFLVANPEGTFMKASDKDFDFHSLRVQLIYKFGQNRGF